MYQNRNNNKSKKQITSTKKDNLMILYNSNNYKKHNKTKKKEDKDSKKAIKVTIINRKINIKIMTKDKIRINRPMIRLLAKNIEKNDDNTNNTYYIQ